MLRTQEITAKPKIKLPGQAPGCLTATACHAGVSLWAEAGPSPGLSLPCSPPDSPQGAVRGVSYANTMLPPTKGLFMHSSYLFTLGGSFR